MDRWGFLCIILSSLVSVIRAEIKKHSPMGNPKIHNTLTIISVILIILGLIFFYA